MSLLNPEEVCCAFTEKIPFEGKLPKEIAPKNSSSNGIRQDERIKKLEIQMTRLAEDMELIKNQHCNAGNAIERAINRGVCGLGGRFRLSNDICVSSCSSDTSKYEKSSRTSCCSGSSRTSSTIGEANCKDNAKTLAKEKEEKNGCSEFVLG